LQELRELTKLHKEGYDVSFRVRQEELDLGMTESSLKELQLASGRPKMRIDALLREAAAVAHQGRSKIQLVFLLSVVFFLIHPFRVS